MKNNKTSIPNFEFNKKEHSHPQFSLGRRIFIRNFAAIGVLFQFGIIYACRTGNKFLSAVERQILTRIQDLLFPPGETGPGALEFGAPEYLIWYLSDPYIPDTEKEYITNGISWIQETSREKHQRDFLDLSPDIQEELIREISRTDWGESWLSKILTLIIEAMISDPVYGFNTQEQGWKWLEHQAGKPRPDATNKYDILVKKVSDG